MEKLNRIRFQKRWASPLTSISRDVGYDVRDYRGLILLLLISQLVVLGTAPLSRDMPFYLVSAICGGLIVAFTAFSVQRFLLLIIIYVSIFSSTQYLTFMPVMVSFKLIAVLVLISLLYWVAALWMRESYTWRITALDKAFAIFLLVTFVGVIIGHRHSNDRFFIFEELFFLSLYVAYFPWVHSSVDKKWIRYFFWAIVGVSGIVSLEYIWESFQRQAILLSRIPTQQAHLAQISIPFLLLFLTITPSKRNKLLALALLILNFIVVLLSQQRALWASIVITSFIVLGIYIFKVRSVVQKIFRLIIFLVLIGAFVLGGVYFIQKLVRGYVGETLGERATTFAAMSTDVSLMVRWIEITQIWNRIEDHPILGNGLGDVVMRRIRWGIANYVDNAYVWLLWKMGAIGLVSYLAIVFLFFKRCKFVLQQTGDEEYRLYTLAALIGFIGLLIIALTNTCITRYRFDLVWAMLIGSVEVMARKVEDRITDSSIRRVT